MSSTNFDPIKVCHCLLSYQNGSRFLQACWKLPLPKAIELVMLITKRERDIEYDMITCRVTISFKSIPTSKPAKVLLQNIKK